MSSDELFQLWQLHLIDKAILDIRNRAANLDPGKKIILEISKLQSVADEAAGNYKTLHAELTDIELKQKGIDEKVKKFDQQLYGGKVVNPREVENIQKEIDMLKKQRGELDERLMELWELVPPAKAKSDEGAKAIETKRAELAEFQKSVLKLKADLESGFKAASAKRGPVAAKVDPGTLVRYEAVRQKQEGTAMTRIMKNGTCETCGTLFPRKSVEAAKEGRWVTCESCHRILYWSESLI